MEKTKTTTKSKPDFVNFQEIVEDNFKKSSAITQQTLDSLSKTYNEQSEIIVDVNKKIVETVKKEAQKPNPDHKEFVKLFDTLKVNIEKVNELTKTNINTLNGAIKNQISLAKETSEKFTNSQFNFDYTKYIDEYQKNVETANKTILNQITEFIKNQKSIDLTSAFEMYQKNIIEANEFITENVTKAFDFYKKQFSMVSDLSKTYNDFVTKQVDSFSKLSRETLEGYWPTNWWKE